MLRERWATARPHWPDPALTINTYGPAARLEFTDGELTAVAEGHHPAGPATDPDTHAAVPPGALLRLARGYRTVPEVLATWPDFVLRDHRTEHFLTVAFPRVEARLWPRT